MANNFNIKLSASLNETILKDSIEKFFSNNTFKIKLEVDQSSLQNSVSNSDKEKIINKNYNVRNRQSIKEGPIVDQADLDKTVETYNKFGNKIKVVTTQYKDLNNIIKTTWKSDRDGSAIATRTIKTNSTGLKENLKLRERNKELIHKLTNSVKSYGSQSKLSKKEVDEFNKKIEDLNKITTEVEKNKAIKNLDSDIKAATNSSGILGQSFAKAMVKYVTWLGIATIVAQITNTIKKMVQEVINLDKAMVELNKVFDASDKDLEKVKKQSFEIAKQLGSTGEEVINATTEFKRMGYTIDESLDLAKIAIMMTNVAEGITDSGDAANILNSIMKGLGVSSDYALSILDRINEVSNKNAVSFDALANMLRESSATMQTLGNNLDETIGLLTGAYSVLQDESVARGIQTIGLRIAGLNEDMETVGGLSNEVVKSLQNLAGINAFDEQSGQLKSTYQILEELAGVWDTIGTNQQRALLNTLAGKTQADVAASILSNWENVDQAVRDAQSSMGSAQQEQIAYLNSIEGRTNYLKNTLQQLADEIIGSDIVKIVLDLINAITNVVAPILKVVSAIMELNGLSVGLKTISMIFETIGLLLDKIAFGVDWVSEKIKPLFKWLEKIVNFVGKHFGVNKVVNEALEKTIDDYKDVSDTYNKYNNQLNTELKTQEKLLEIEKARLALREAQNRRIRIFRAGQGFVYEQDTSAIQSAYENLAEILGTKNIDNNYTGTTNFKGGYTWVGENGPEIMKLPKGTEILDNDKSVKLHSIVNNPNKYLTNSQGKNTTLQFNGPLNFPNVKNSQDAEGFINSLIKLGNNKIPKLN